MRTLVKIAFLIIAVVVVVNIVLLSETTWWKEEEEDVEEDVWREFARTYEYRYNRTAPSGLRRWMTFATSRNCSLEHQHYDAIDADVGEYRVNSPLTPPDPTQYPFPYASYTLMNNELVLHHDDIGWRNSNLRWVLEPLRQHQPPINDLPILFYLLDEPEAGLQNAPISFSWSKRIDPTTGASLTPRMRVPYVNDMTSNHVRERWRRFSAAKKKKLFHREVAWENKKDAIVWRGSTTGGMISSTTNWTKYVRFRLVDQFGRGGVHKLSSNMNVDVDVAFSGICQCRGDCPTMMRPYRFAKRKPFNWNAHHKYIIDVDGNSFTERFPKLLQTHSLVFKITTYVEWFSDRVFPWRDYIPVNYSTFDMHEKVGWALDHEDEAREIAARETSKRMLRREDMQCYVYRLMLEYAELFHHTASKKNTRMS